MKVEFHPATVDELNEAITYYSAKRDGLGDKLKFEIYSTIDRITDTPELYPEISTDFHITLEP